MRILKIVPGTGGGFLCENCLRDQALIAELRWAGHDLLLVPLYLPLAGSPPSERDAVPVFYGAVRIFLEHRFPLLRGSPAWLRRKLDSQRLLQHAASRAGVRSSPVLADLTLSVLRGESGGQARELQTLCDWLQEHPRPDVIHLSSLLLIGLARRLGSVLKAPLVCSIQDEDIWVAAMPGPVAKRAWAELRARIPDVAGFVASSRFYAEKMQRRLGLPLRCLRVVHPGVDAAAIPFVQKETRTPVWGVLLSPDDPDSLGRVLDAFLEAKSRHACCTGLRLRVSGASRHTNPVSRGVAWRETLAARGWTRDVEFLPAFSRHSDRLAFLRSLSVFTVLHREEPAFDLSLLEAMAGGVVVVQPDRGANPEILAMSDGGLLYDPETPRSLPLALVQAVAERSVRAERGRYGVEHGFSVGRMAREMVEAYQAALSSHQPLRAGERRS